MWSRTSPCGTSQRRSERQRRTERSGRDRRRIGETRWRRTRSDAEGATTASFAIPSRPAVGTRNPGLTTGPTGAMASADRRRRGEPSRRRGVPGRGRGGAPLDFGRGHLVDYNKTDYSLATNLTRPGCKRTIGLGATTVVPEAGSGWREVANHAVPVVLVKPSVRSTPLRHAATPRARSSESISGCQRRVIV
jgi:hypothetical protein